MLENLSQVNHSINGVFTFEEKRFKEICEDIRDNHLAIIIKDLLAAYMNKNEFVDAFFVNDAIELEENKKQKMIKLVNSTDLIKELSKLNSSLKLSGAQNVFSPLKDLFNDLYKEHNIAFTCNIYITPAIKESCFKYHADSQDVYIMQVLGEKTWTFPKIDNQKLKQSLFEKGSTIEQNYENLFQLQLNELEGLKISQGFVHKAENLNTKLSIHLSFSTFPKSDVDLINIFKGKLLNFEKSILKSYMLNNTINEKMTKELIEMLIERVDLINVDQETQNYEKQHKVKNSFIAKFGRPYSEKQIKIFEMLTKVKSS